MIEQFGSHKVAALTEDVKKHIQHPTEQTGTCRLRTNSVNSVVGTVWNWLERSAWNRAVPLGLGGRFYA